MKVKFTILLLFLLTGLASNLIAQSAPGCDNCRTTPICTLEKNQIRFEFLGASENQSGTTQIRFSIVNFSRNPFEHVTFELPGKNIAATAPTASFISRYHYAVQNPYSDSLIKFTGLNTATYRYDEQDQFRYEVNSALLHSPGNALVQISVKAGELSSTVVFDLENCARQTVTPLPVELISFKGSATNQGVALTWVTASEKDCSYFTVQHSTNGAEFNAIGKVNGNGTTSATKTYSFSHEMPQKGGNYYRLKQVDLEGSYSYSPIILVNAEPAGNTAADFAVYPNPVAGENLYIRLPQAATQTEKAFILITDLNSREILRQEALAGQEIILPLKEKSLKAGLYLVKVQQGENQLIRKIIIQ